MTEIRCPLDHDRDDAGTTTAEATLTGAGVAAARVVAASVRLAHLTWTSSWPGTYSPRSGTDG
jgi:hypothetical protein